MCARRLGLELESRSTNAKLVKAREAAEDAGETYELARAREEKRALETRIEAVYGDFDKRFDSAAQAIVSAAASNARLVRDVERANNHNDLLRPLPAPEVLCSQKFLSRLWIPRFWFPQWDRSRLNEIALSPIVQLPAPNDLAGGRRSIDEWDIVRNRIRETIAQLVSLYETSAREIVTLLKNERHLRRDIHTFNGRWEYKVPDLKVQGRSTEMADFPIRQVVLPLPLSNDLIWP